MQEKVDWFQGAPLGQLVYDRTYSRTKEDGTKEDWLDTVGRVVRGNINFVDEKFIEEGEAEELFDLIASRKMIPAGRHLWVTGVPGRSFTQNCHVAGFEEGLAAHCEFVFSELMKGGGVGANYSSHYLENMPPLSKVTVRFTCREDHEDFNELLPLLGENELFDPPQGILYEVPDSREGWVEALRLLLEAASNHVPANYTILFDVSKIRCKGSPIRGFGGISSGPWPLVNLLNEVATLIERFQVRINESTSVCLVTPPLAMEIDHLIAGAVIAGNVRRSARMSIMHWNDPFIDWFLNCKSDHTDHWSTNISVEVDNDFFIELAHSTPKAFRLFNTVVDGMMRDGEPGFYNSSLASKGESTHIGATNPCGEMPLESWESCNLGHINLAFGTDADHERAFRLMARFLLRATFCDIQDPKQRAVVDRNRRIGVGFFGLQEWLALRGIKYSGYNQHGILADNLTRWYQIVREESDRYAELLGINAPIKCTTIAPTGTIAKLAGTSEGMQPIYAKYYIRRVRYATNDPEVSNLLASGVHVEPCIYSANTVVASFYCEDPILSRVPGQYVEEQHEISERTALAIQADIQRYYADNAISLTVNIPPAHTNQHISNAQRTNLSNAIKTYLPHVKGLTVFPEASRPQSPIERITKEEYEKATKPTEIRAGTSDIMEEACSTGACPIR